MVHGQAFTHTHIYTSVPWVHVRLCDGKGRRDASAFSRQAAASGRTCGVPANRVSIDRVECPPALTSPRSDRGALRLFARAVPLSLRSGYGEGRCEEALMCVKAVQELSLSRLLIVVVTESLHVLSHVSA